MFQDKKQIEVRIGILESKWQNCRKQFKRVHPVHLRTPNGKSKSSIQAEIWQIEAELKQLRARLARL